MLATDPLSLVFIGCAVFSGAFLVISTLLGAGESHIHFGHLGGHTGDTGGHDLHVGHADSGGAGHAAHAADGGHAMHGAHAHADGAHADGAHADSGSAQTVQAGSTFPDGRYPNLFLFFLAPTPGHTVEENQKALENRN